MTNNFYKTVNKRYFTIALDKKRRKRDETAKEILEQIEIQKQLYEQRKKEENALDQAFTTLAQVKAMNSRTRAGLPFCTNHLQVGN